MTKLFAIGRSNLMAKQWCFTHADYCNLFDPIDMDISGLPCWDMSLAGNRRAEQGMTNAVFMVHAKMHKERGTPLMILENVQA